MHAKVADCAMTLLLAGFFTSKRPGICWRMNSRQTAQNPSSEQPVRASRIPPAHTLCVRSCLPCSPHHQTPVERFVPASRYLLLLLLLVSVSCGCVRRRLTVRSNPPGALVYIDDQEIGRTPVSTPFTYYGTRKFRLMKDGYETITVNQRFPAPWYEIPPLDFLTENLWVREIRDERLVEFELVPQSTVSMNDVLSQADKLRSAARR